MLANSTSSIAEHQDDVSEFPTTSPFNRHTTAELERNERIERYYPLVEKTLARLRCKLPSHINADDLRSAGIMGLVAAAERFDPAQAGAFAGYACLRIRGAILDELRQVDPCSRRSRLRERKIQAATQEAAQTLGRTPTDVDVSTRLQISVRELSEWRAATVIGHLVSLDVQTDQNSATAHSLHEIIPDHDQECVRDTMEKQELLELVSNRITELPTIEKQILSLYYFEGMRFAEIGAAFNLTESRVCQIHKQAVGKLRAFIRSARER
jgi:RNA polymerase sigma factor for flagellar operon FliA